MVPYLKDKGLKQPFILTVSTFGKWGYTHLRGLKGGAVSKCYMLCVLASKRMVSDF